MDMLTLADVRDAEKRLKPYLIRTPLVRVEALDHLLGCEAYLKLEGLQVTGSFKARGALNALLALTDDEKKHGVIAASSGNHAQGVAYAGQKLGVSAQIVMPFNANPVKLAKVRDYGAEVIITGTVTSERDAKVRELVEKDGRIEVHAFANKYVKAGQGTIGLEIIEDEPAMDVVIVSVGGGGLISGVSTAVKGVKPECKVFGIEPLGAPRYSKSIEAGEPIKLEKVNTIADGTRTDKADPVNFEIIKANVDKLFTATEDEIRAGMKTIVSKGHVIAEPSSSMGVGMALSGRIPYKKTDKVCFVLSGGNNDLEFLREVLA